MNSDNPLGIRDIEGEFYIPLAHISEEEVERLREKHLPQNTIDSTAEELGPKAPGIKDDAAERSRKLMEEAMGSPISDDRLAEKGDTPPSPKDVLG